MPASSFYLIASAAVTDLGAPETGATQRESGGRKSPAGFRSGAPVEIAPEAEKSSKISHLRTASFSQRT